MDILLHFFANLILFTAGLLVVVFWIIAIIVAAVEGHDIYLEYYKSDQEDS